LRVSRPENRPREAVRLPDEEDLRPGGEDRPKERGARTVSAGDVDEVEGGRLRRSLSTRSGGDQIGRHMARRVRFWDALE